MATAAPPRTAAIGGSFLIQSSLPESVFTPEDFTGDQRLIGQTAEEFVAKDVIPLIPELEQHKERLMATLLKKAGEIGLLGGGVPEEFGGSGLDRISSMLLSEKASAYASFSVTVGAHSGIGTLPIVYFGTAEQKRKYLPKLATGEWIASYCLSEPQAGSDAQNARTRAVLSPDGRHWLLNGQKMWITNGGFADVYIVFAKVDGEKFSAFIVERGFPGFSVGAEEKKMGLRGSSTVPIFFENCQVPRENLLHEIGRGHIVAFNILNVGRFSLGAACIGGAKNEIEAAARYARERTAFGHRIGEFGLIRAKLAEMSIRTFALESIIYRTAGLIEQQLEREREAAANTGTKPPRTGQNTDQDTDASHHAMKLLEEYAVECSIAKVYGSEVLDYVVDEAVQIYGGYGFHEDYPVARGYRDSRVNRIFEGTNEINRLLIIQMLIKRALAGSLPLLAAGAKLQEEILSGPLSTSPSSASPDASPDSSWSNEERTLAGAKKLFLLAAGTAMQKHRERLADQQEIVAALADIVIEMYAMESALLRAQKQSQKSEGARGGIASDISLSTSPMTAAARVLLHDSADRIESCARTVLSATAEGDTLRTQLAVLRRFAKREPVDTIALRRVVADAVESANRYPF
jgi:alkylation response protein AidB-like acyl-CoA dehydrogenase